MRKGNKKLHTKDKYVVYLINCDDCGRPGADADDRTNSIEWALQKGFRNYKGKNLCPECLEKAIKKETK
jgi:hypothetical protein